MKNISLLVMALSANAFAVDYGGADKYPVQSVTGGSYVLVVNGVDIDPSYDLQAKAISAASLLSIKCGCLVSIRQPTIKYSTEWRVAVRSSSSSSSKSSAPSSASSSSSSRVAISGYIEWEPPTKREDGSALDKVLAYHVIYDDKYFSVDGSKTKLAVDKTYGTALIAASDTSGVISSYAEATIKAVF